MAPQPSAPDLRLAVPVVGTALGDGTATQKLISLWLRAAEQAHQGGDREGAKALIDRVLDRDPHNEAAWQRYFEYYGIEPMLVVYEDLVEAYEETALNILHYLRVPVPENFAFAERRMKQQADMLSEDWVRRFYAFEQKREKAG